MKIVIENDQITVKAHGETTIYSGALPSLFEIINEFADENKIKIVFRRKAK